MITAFIVWGLVIAACVGMLLGAAHMLAKKDKDPPP